MEQLIGIVKVYEAARGRGVICHMMTFQADESIAVYIGDKEDSWEDMGAYLHKDEALGMMMQKYLENSDGIVYITALGLVSIEAALECLAMALVQFIQGGGRVH